MSQHSASIRRHTVLMGALVLAAAGLAPATARAFSDQDRFLEAAAKGGGGGRFYTGSTADGFACGVCHRGASAPSVQISGLPDDFVAGMTYDVSLGWDNSVLSHGINLELVTGENLAAGTIALPEDAQITATERCQGQATQPPAAKIQAQGGRQILTVQNCGSSLVRFRWTAPPASEVTFAAGVVRSDASATAEGDGVLELSRALLPVGASREASGGCSVRPSGRASLAWLGVVGSLLTVLRRRRTHR